MRECGPDKRVNRTTGHRPSFKSKLSNFKDPIPGPHYRKCNAGKTTILQRVRDTTECPTISRNRGGKREKACDGGLMLLPVSPQTTQVTLDQLDPSTKVGEKFVCCRLLTLSQRGKHEINDELVFSNNTGYVFHDSWGIESSVTEELDIL